MTVSIRPHHLLCILTYLGKGYTASFVQNYNGVIKRLNAGETVTIVTGPDDICRAMLNEDGCHCHNDSVLERDAIALAQVSNFLDRDVGPGQPVHLTPDRIAGLRKAFAAGEIRGGCAGCEWSELCTSISARNFAGCHLSTR
ncbi:DUF1284 domain-containing protein [uncultured Roseibium sp.]|uniref:DUF1284 domain-containing protein n=1 Tax=uncultured Roseibium sp. TaxID=1936171 RepID=UPI00263240EC|nr:DUF1284 domain-containing protein [uncultured Roseibium sp.]